jgi:hypothetical protein
MEEQRKRVCCTLKQKTDALDLFFFLFSVLFTYHPDNPIFIVFRPTPRSQHGRIGSTVYWMFSSPRRSLRLNVKSHSVWMKPRLSTANIIFLFRWTGKFVLCPYTYGNETSRSNVYRYTINIKSVLRDFQQEEWHAVLKFNQPCSRDDTWIRETIESTETLAVSHGHKAVTSEVRNSIWHSHLHQLNYHHFWYEDTGRSATGHRSSSGTNGRH